MFGLTPLGLVHTAVSLVALAAGIAALIRFGEIPARHPFGRTYIWATVLTCLTGFGIFRHGGFGAPHALGVLTLLVLAVAMFVGIKPVFGRASRYIETIAYSVTLFFHMIPGLTETFTRLPVGAPLFSSPDDPALQKVVGGFFLLLLIGCGLQAWRLHAGRAPWQPARPAV